MKLHVDGFQVCCESECCGCEGLVLKNWELGKKCPALSHIYSSLPRPSDQASQGDTPQKCHFTLGFCILNVSIAGCPQEHLMCSWVSPAGVREWHAQDSQQVCVIKPFDSHISPQKCHVPLLFIQDILRV
jgi:hypothetical protein